jgi:hypothetical protein
MQRSAEHALTAWANTTATPDQGKDPSDAQFAATGGLYESARAESAQLGCRTRRGLSGAFVSRILYARLESTIIGCGAPGY